MRSSTGATETTGGTPPVDETAVRSRKRFARRQWARRWLAWRYVVAILLVIVLVVGSVWLVLFSSVLAVNGVEVHGAKTLSAAQVRAVADVPEGEPLARVDLDRIQARVEALEEVRSADVTRQWPDQVLIEVVEREAIAVVDIGGQIRGMDKDGVVFREYRQAPPGLPRVQTSTGTRSEALREAAAVVSALPRGPRGPGRPRGGGDHRPDHAGARRRPHRDVGECGRVGAEGGGPGHPAEAGRSQLRRVRARPADHVELIRANFLARVACLHDSPGSAA